MKGDTEVVRHLNVILTNEMTAINQYFLHAKMFEDWGFAKLAAHEHHESIDEMKHADMLIKRILFLEGMPMMHPNTLLIGPTVPEALACDLKLEQAGHPCLKAAIAYAESVGDFVSRELFEEILTSEEEHIDWLETQLQLIATLGIENYLQAQLDDDDASPSSS